MVVIWRPVALTVIFLRCSLKFSMMPTEWRDMVERTRELELALGSEEKIVMDNEVDTVVVQRRAIRASTSIIKGEKFTRENLTVLRPCPKDGLPPYKLVDILDKKSKRNIKTGEVIHIEDFIK